jgi:diaminohydroxyphosphoribosylaminopyrimidine deaminase/5-amino-6-(5-phosphoribosylamino)uracil reductase
VLVGVGTVLADDPLLTCRLARPRRVAARVVLDAHLRTPPSCRLARSARRSPVLIFTSARAPAARRRTLTAAGCEVLTVPARRLLYLPAVLDELGRRRMTNVLVEGGARVLGSFFDEGLADEAVVFVAPRLIGGAAAPGPLGGRGVADAAAARPLRVVECRPCGPDRMWRFRLT